MKINKHFIKRINRFFPIFFAAVFFLVAITVLTYYSFVRELATKNRIMNRQETGLVLLDRNGEPFFTFFDAITIDDVSLSTIPDHMEQAVISAEDKRYYTHEGYSILGIIRAAIINIREQEIAYGGSTITQQLVKNALLNPQRSFLRKYQEVVLAQEIERRYTKYEILQMYLNSVYFGEGAFGVDQAAETYFNKSASELTIAESALLASLLPAPSEMSPLSGDRSRALNRQKLILDIMAQEGYITQEQLERAKDTKLVFRSKPQTVNNVAPHFAIMIRNRLVDEYGEEEVIRSGMKVHTTLNREWQQLAQNIVSEHVERLSVQNIDNGAAVVIDPETRHILAMVGSKDWDNPEFGKVNVALSPRQPGSSFKPIVYATALEQRVITPATILHDVPTTYDRNYQPTNYDNRFRGPITVRRALANSVNVPAVEVITMVGMPDVLSKAKEFGISSLGEPVNYGPSLALGAGEVTPLELTNVYATFADGGMYKEPVSIFSIEDKYGDTVYEHEQTKERVISEETAFLISSILSDEFSRREVFGTILDTRVDAAVKTGTTDDYRDAWTLGYTPQIAVGVWVGNNDNTPIYSVPGSMGAGPIWKEIINTLTSDEQVAEFTPPDGVVRVRICNNGLLVPPGANVGYEEYFINGTEPTAYCSLEPTPTPKDEDKP